MFFIKAWGATGGCVSELPGVPHHQDEVGVAVDGGADAAVVVQELIFAHLLVRRWRWSESGSDREKTWIYSEKVLDQGQFWTRAGSEPGTVLDQNRFWTREGSGPETVLDQRRFCRALVFKLKVKTRVKEIKAQKVKKNCVMNVAEGGDEDERINLWYKVIYQNLNRTYPISSIVPELNWGQSFWHNCFWIKKSAFMCGWEAEP